MWKIMNFYQFFAKGPLLTLLFVFWVCFRFSWYWKRIINRILDFNPKRYFRNIRRRITKPRRERESFCNSGGRKGTKGRNERKNDLRRRHEPFEVSDSESSCDSGSSSRSIVESKKEKRMELIVMLTDIQKRHLSDDKLKKLNAYSRDDPEIRCDIWSLISCKPKLKLGIFLAQKGVEDRVVGIALYRQADTALRIVHVSCASDISLREIVLRASKKLHAICKNFKQLVNVEVIVGNEETKKGEISLWKEAGFVSSILNRKIPLQARGGELLTMFSQQMSKRERMEYDMARIHSVDFCVGDLKARAARAGSCVISSEKSSNEEELSTADACEGIQACVDDMEVDGNSNRDTSCNVNEDETLVDSNTASNSGTPFKTSFQEDSGKTTRKEDLFKTSRNEDLGKTAAQEAFNEAPTQEDFDNILMQEGLDKMERKDNLDTSTAQEGLCKTLMQDDSGKLLIENEKEGSGNSSESQADEILSPRCRNGGTEEVDSPLNIIGIAGQCHPFGISDSLNYSRGTPSSEVSSLQCVFQQPQYMHGESLDLGSKDEDSKILETSRGIGDDGPRSPPPSDSREGDGTEHEAADVLSSDMGKKDVLVCSEKTSNSGVELPELSARPEDLAKQSCLTDARAKSATVSSFKSNTVQETGEGEISKRPQVIAKLTKTEKCEESEEGERRSVVKGMEETLSESLESEKKADEWKPTLYRGRNYTKFNSAEFERSLKELVEQKLRE